MKKRKYNRPKGKEVKNWRNKDHSNYQKKALTNQKFKKMEKLTEFIKLIKENPKMALLVLIIGVAAYLLFGLTGCKTMRSTGTVNWEVEAMKAKIEKDSIQAILDEKSQKEILVWGRQSGTFPSYALMELRA